MFNMKKYTTVFWQDLENEFRPSLATQLLVRGKTFSTKNTSFSKCDLKQWIENIQSQNREHPILAELVLLGSYLQNHKVSLVLV